MTGHGWLVIDDVQLVGCDKLRAGTPIHGLGVPALPLVTPCRFANWPAVQRHATDMNVHPANFENFSCQA